MSQNNTVDLMGAVVLVHEVYKRKSTRENFSVRRTWEKEKAEGRPGWVVGERWLHDGVVSSWGYEDGVDWKADGKTHHCLLVCYWPTMKPVNVPMRGFTFASETEKPYPPVQPIHGQELRDYLREEMSAWPRDEKGRWVKKCQP